MKEFVVGVDGSDESRLALRWAARVAEASNAALRIVGAWTYPGASGLPGAEPLATPQAMDTHTAEQLSAVATEELGAVPGFADVEVLRGPPAAAIVQGVTPESTLVLGSRGRGGFAGLLLGSVSRECLEYAPCAVVIVRHDQPIGEGHGPILVGTDGSANATRALDWAEKLRDAVGGDIGAVYAWEPRMSEKRPQLHERLRSEAQAVVESWVGGREHVRAIEVEGDPRSELLDAASRMDASLVVVGRRGGGRLRGLRVGGVTNYLMSNSPTTVAVIPPADALDEDSGPVGARGGA